MISEIYKQMPASEQQSYRRWLAGNLILSSLIGVGMLTMVGLQMIRHEPGDPIASVHAPLSAESRTAAR
jgi:hypothetical protein